MPLKFQTLNIPYRPLLGSQKFFEKPSGLRGNEPGGYGLPRSSRQTRLPASARRYAVTEPPKPDPTTTASKCSLDPLPIAGLISPAADGERTLRRPCVQLAK